MVRRNWLWGAVSVAGLAVGCAPPAVVGVDLPAGNTLLGSGSATFDATTGTVTWTAFDRAGELLDSSDVLPSATAHNCEAAGWNPSSRVLSVNAFIANQSAAAVYLAPVELRITGIAQANIVASVNTDLVNAGCGAHGLTLASADLDHNGTFDCIWPDDASNTADDPGWDFSQTLGSDNALAPGEWSACRFVHFNLLVEANFTFYWQILGVVDDGWPPPPAIDAVASPTQNSAPTISGACVTTLTAPDQLSPPPAQIPTTNEITFLGGAAPVTTICDDTVFPCQTVGGVTYCGRFSASVPLVANTPNRLEVFQTLDGADRSNSSYVTVVHDSLPPQVVSTNPPDAAVGISPAANLVVTFSEAMDGATINSVDAASANIYVRRQGQTARLPATVTLASAAEAVIDPAAELPNSRTYELVITTGVRDLVGLALPAQVVVTFATAKRDDTVAPVVLGVQPPSGAVNVDRRSTVAITFSEAMLASGTTNPASPTCVDSGTVTCTAIRVLALSTGLRVPGTRMMSPDGATVTFQVNDAAYDSTGPDLSGAGCFGGQPPTAALDFDCNRSYRLEIATTLTDLAGNRLEAAHVSTFATGIEPDLVPPYVVAIAPPPGAAGVAVGIQPEVLFSEPVQAGTVNGTSITLKQDGVMLVAASVSLSADGLLARLTPTALLALDTRYVLFVNNTISDVAGNPLAAPQNASFTTVAVPDTTPPVVLSVSPANEAGNVSVATNVQATFSEALAPATVNTATFVLERYKNNGTTIESAVVGVVSLSGDRMVATFAPEQVLAKDRRHRVTVTTGVTDAAGNPMAATFVSTFTTVKDDAIPPCVTAVGPAPGSTTVARNSHFAVTFSEPMSPPSVVPSSFALRNAGGTLLTTIVSLSADGMQASLVPVAPLPLGSVTLQPRTALTDASAQQNALDQRSPVAGCLEPSGPASPTFGFTVVDTLDTTPPTVLSLTPLNGSTNVPVDTTIVVTFSESMDPLSLNDDNIGLLVDAIGNRVPAVRTFSPDVTGVTIAPLVLLTTATAYRVTVAAGGPRDLAGNALGVGAQTTFVTTAPSGDTTRPQVLSVCPPDNATNVDRLLRLGCNAAFPGTVIIVFSEPLNGNTVVVGNIRLLEVSNNPVDRTQAVALQPDGITVVLTPAFRDANGLKNGTTHQVRVSTAVTDLAGNPLSGVEACSAPTGGQCTDFGT